MKGIVLSLIVLVLVLGSVSAEKSIGSAEQGECISLSQTCSNCTFVNITSLVYPNKTIQKIGSQMTKNGTDYNYTFCSTQQIGDYFYNTIGDLNGIIEAEPISFEITTSGASQINSGQGFILASSLIVLLVIGILFFFLGIYSQTIGKVIFFTLAGIMMIIALLFSLVALQQILGGYTNIIESYSAAWFVIKIVVGVGLLFLVLFIGYSAYALWLKRRGFT